VALVGYTNAGKSTLMNLLAKTNVLAENRLFATLDTTVRRVEVGNLPLLLSDTVGFIRKLPTRLVESFKTTLSEVCDADLLLHVVDVTHMYYIEHIRTVRDTLADIKAADKPTIYVFNKIDQLEPEELADLEDTWVVREQVPAVFISAENRQGIDQLRDLMAAYLHDIYKNKYPGVDYYQHIF